MAGRVTYLQDFAEKEGGWEPPVTLKNGARIGLENALGRKLTSGEVATIEKDIAPIRFMRTGFTNAEALAAKRGGDKEARRLDRVATAQDVKRTLENIGKLPPSEALAAYRKSDSDTACHIDEAMCVNLGIAPDSSEFRLPRGENIAKAAMVALENMGDGAVGRPSKAHYREWLASYTLSLWAKLGGSNINAYSWDETNTPIVEFMIHLASIVDDEILDPRNAAKLLKRVNVTR